MLDIGTGTGILAVMAARAGAAHVYACEVNGVLCDIAREVMERCGAVHCVAFRCVSSRRVAFRGVTHCMHAPTLLSPIIR